MRSAFGDGATYVVALTEISVGGVISAWTRAHGQSAAHESTDRTQARGATATKLSRMVNDSLYVRPSWSVTVTDRVWQPVGPPALKVTRPVDDTVNGEFIPVSV